MSLEAYRPYLGRVVTLHGPVGRGKKWKVASIHAGHPNHPWGWMVRLDKPMDQCRLSLAAKEVDS